MGVVRLLGLSEVNSNLREMSSSFSIFRLISCLAEISKLAILECRLVSIRILRTIKDSLNQPITSLNWGISCCRKMERFHTLSLFNQRSRGYFLGDFFGLRWRASELLDDRWAWRRKNLSMAAARLFCCLVEFFDYVCYCAWKRSSLWRV